MKFYGHLAAWETARIWVEGCFVFRYPYLILVAKNEGAVPRFEACVMQTIRRQGSSPILWQCTVDEWFL